MSDAPSWIKVYRSIILSNKKTEDMPNEKLGAYLKLLILADNETGKIDLSNTTIKRLLGAGYMHKSRLLALERYMVSRRLIDRNPDGCLYIHNWKTRQANRKRLESDSWLTERQTRVTDTASLPSDEPIKLSCENDTKNSGHRGRGSIFALFKGYISLKNKSNNTLQTKSNAGLIHTGATAELQESLISENLFGECSKGNVLGKSGEEFRLAGEDSRLALRTQLTQKTNYQTFIADIQAHWQQCAGLIHHKQYTDMDNDACKRCLINYKGNNGNGLQVSVDMIKLSISNYSAHVIGSRQAGDTPAKYRECYRWTFYEFITRHRHALIGRYASANWEDTCLPFANRQQAAPKSVSSLLAQFSK
jgi:hypothetical protein